MTRKSWLQESSTSRAILAEGEARGVAVGEARGRVDEARRLLLALGTEKFGAPDLDTSDTVVDINDVETLERLLRRVLTKNTWTELLSSETDRQ